MVGEKTPVIVELDLHGNITPEMVSLATLCVAYDEYPHIDIYERAYEMGLLMMKILRGGAKPTPHIINIPLLSQPPKQYTFDGPMFEFKKMAWAVEAGI